MGTVSLNATGFGNALAEMMLFGDIQPGDAPSYEVCKTIYEYHPLGAKLVEVPIKLAQSQPRKITVSNGPKDQVRDAFIDEWAKIGADAAIFNHIKLSRIYGIASLVLLVDGQQPDHPVKFEDLWKKDIAFSVFDPLNTAGSLVYNQNPNAFDFQKNDGSVSVQGQLYHRSRTCVKLNEEPIYLGWTNSAYGYVGRSVYQRTLYAMKSYLQTMRTDDLVARKAGVIIAKIKAAGSIISAAMEAIAGFKRNILKEAQTDNVINVEPDESVESINLENVNGAMSESRKNILNNIAAGAGQPAILVNEETFAEGFGEGTEDAKLVAMYIEEFRKDLRAIYEFMDNIVQYRAWNEEFFNGLKNEFPKEYGKKTFNEAFQGWRKAFKAEWPSFLTEPESEQAKKDKIRLEGITDLLELFLPIADPDNISILAQWAQDNFNQLETLFSVPLFLDCEALGEYAEEQKEQEQDLAEQQAANPAPAAGGKPPANGGGGKSKGGPAAKTPKPPSPRKDAQRRADVSARITELIKNAGKK